MKVFITGGARSGKSDFAERYAMKLAQSGIYIATSQIWDEEMVDRIDRHRRVREESGYPWRTIEEPYALAGLLRELEAEQQSWNERPAVLVDCLTLWLTNWLLRFEQSPMPAGGGGGEPSRDQALPDQRLEDAAGGQVLPDQRLEDTAADLVDAVAAYTGPLLLVTNEVGGGIVPSYPLGRRFRDEAGRLNRRLAAVCGQAFLVVAGFPLDLKAHAFRLEEL